MPILTALELSGRSLNSVRRPTREARLRPEFAELYLGVQPGEWTSAALLADRVLADSLLRGSDLAIRGRVLPDSHFDFRGGRSEGGQRDGVREVPWKAGLHAPG